MNRMRRTTVNHRLTGLVAAFVLGLYQVSYACPPAGVSGEGAGKHEDLTVFYAASLRGVMRDLVGTFRKTYSHLDVHEEAGGSRELAYMVAHLKRKADILFVADPLVIKDLLMPDHADWYIEFGSNPLVIAYTERSRYGDQITSDNWYQILSRRDVRIGRANEHLAPLGYRTLMAWQLADLHYKDRVDGKRISEALAQNCPPAHIRPSEMEILPPLQSYDLDYIFEYRNVARSQNLKYVELPDEVNLGNSDLASWYAQAAVQVSGKQRGTPTTVTGTPIRYAFAFLKDPAHQCALPLAGAAKAEQELATQCLNHNCDLTKKQWVCILDFVKALLNDEGRQLLEANGFGYARPVASDPSRLPKELRELVQSPEPGEAPGRTPGPLARHPSPGSP